jgi:hypothetical protein
MTAERDIQNDIRRECGNGDTRLFRQQTGEGWTGDAVKLKDGSVLIRNPRRFIAGFKGLPDTGGWTMVTITPEMVGTVIAVAVQIEIKSETGRLRKAQRRFLALCWRMGVRAGVARSVADAKKIIAGG